MAKQLLKERFQQLAGIKPLYELDEAANTNLELKSAAKQLFQRFKKLGAKVTLTDQTRYNKDQSGLMKLGDDEKELDNMDVVIFVDEDSRDMGTVGVDLIGKKAASFEGKIKNLFPQFKIRDIGDGETWGGQKIKKLRFYNKGAFQFSQGDDPDKSGQAQQTTE